LLGADETTLDPLGIGTGLTRPNEVAESLEITGIVRVVAVEPRRPARSGAGSLEPASSPLDRLVMVDVPVPDSDTVFMRSETLVRDSGRPSLTKKLDAARIARRGVGIEIVAGLAAQITLAGRSGKGLSERPTLGAFVETVLDPELAAAIPTDLVLLGSSEVEFAPQRSGQDLGLDILLAGFLPISPDDVRITGLHVPGRRCVLVGSSDE
jgi:hypothetical protein